MEFEKIVKIISEQLGVDASSITKETALVDDLGADSLDVVELIMAMEEEFDMEIADGEADGIKTVGDILDYIKANA
ncbi:MAG: acyl carrier protein [Clostridia bacterium]|nr:acyl carrier protein [Clostridia bacterium]